MDATKSDKISHVIDNKKVKKSRRKANGKIAPGGSATATLVLDLTGTEVATDIHIDLSNATGLPEGIVMSATANGILMEKNENVYGTMIPLNAEKTAISSNTVTLVITLTWEDDEINNSSDTIFGNEHGSFTIPAIITVKQHIGAIAIAKKSFK